MSDKKEDKQFWEETNEDLKEQVNEESINNIVEKPKKTEDITFRTPIPPIDLDN